MFGRDDECGIPVSLELTNKRKTNPSKSPLIRGDLKTSPLIRGD